MKKVLSSKSSEKEKMVIIYSTFAVDIAYNVHDLIRGSNSIIIKGICNAEGDDKDCLVITPKLISSKIPLSAYELLKLDHVFSRHLKDGLLKIEIVDGEEEVQEDIDKEVAIEDDENKIADEKKEEDKTEKDD